MTRFWLVQFFCCSQLSQRDTLDSAKMPPFLDMSTPAVAVRALARVSAQLSTSARGAGGIARRGSAPRARASSDGWAASGVEIVGPWPSRVSRGGVLLHQVARRSPHSSRGLPAQIFKRRKNAGRAVERTPAWVEGVFANSPQT